MVGLKLAVGVHAYVFLSVKVMLHPVTVPISPVVLSLTTKFHVPFIEQPLTKANELSGTNVPVKGAVPAVIEVPVREKVVLV